MTMLMSAAGEQPAHVDEMGKIIAVDDFFTHTVDMNENGPA
jgi:hypothetical protein